MLFNCNVHLENPPAPTLVTLTTPTPPATQLAYRLMQAAMGVHAIIYRTETRAPEPLPTQAMDVVSDVAVPPPNGPSDQNHTAAGTTQATEAHSDQAEAMASTQTAPEPAQTTVAEQSAAPTMGDDAAPSTGPAPVHANTGPQQAQEPDPAMAMSQTTAPDPTDDKDKEYEMVSSGQPTTVAPEDGPSGASSEAGFVVVEIPKEMETNRPSAAPPVTSVRAELGTTAAYEVIPGVGAPPGDGGGGGAGSGPFL